MSDQTVATSDDGGLGDDLAHPLTRNLTILDEEYNDSDEMEADKSIDNSPEEKPIFKQTDSGSSSDDEAPDTEDDSTQPRPKTVTLKSTDEHKKRLVDMGAVSSQEDIKVVLNKTNQNSQEPPQVRRCFSPKPKSEGCYICGKEFLLSSLKVHEKQCAKKLAKENERQSMQEAQNGRKSTTNTQKVNSNFVSKIPRKLKLEACYLCGKEFFSHSLGVHETQCIKNWKADKTPEAKEKSVAEAPNLKQSNQNLHPETEVHNKKHTKSEDNPAEESPKGKKSPKVEKKSEGKQKVLKTIPCSMCGVQLLGHSLKIHEKKCQSRKESIEEGGDGSKRAGSTEYSSEENINKTEVLESGKETENPRISKKPRTVICYICGQEFLKSSYTVHEKQCASKSKVKSEQESIKMANNKGTTMVRKSETTTEGSPRKPKTQKCFLCGKEMLLSSLKIHEQQCQRKLEILKNINQQSSPEQKPQSTAPRKTGAKPKTEICYVCGEAFLSSSIKVHEVQCEKRLNANKKTKA